MYATLVEYNKDSSFAPIKNQLKILVMAGILVFVNAHYRTTHHKFTIKVIISIALFLSFNLHVETIFNEALQTTTPDPINTGSRHGDYVSNTLRPPLLDGIFGLLLSVALFKSIKYKQTRYYKAFLFCFFIQIGAIITFPNFITITPLLILGIYNFHRLNEEETTKPHIIKTTKSDKEIIPDFYNKSPVPFFLLDNYGEIITSNIAAQKELPRLHNCNLITRVAEYGFKKSDFTSAILNEHIIKCNPIEIPGDNGNSTFSISLYRTEIYANKSMIVARFEDISDASLLQNAIKKLAVGISTEIGEKYLDDFTRTLQNVLKFTHVYIGFIDNPEKPERINTKSFSAFNALTSNIGYNIKNTPCELAIKKGFYEHEGNLATDFPYATCGIDPQSEAYIGHVIYDEHSTPIAILAAYNHNKVNKVERYSNIVKVYSSHLSSELIRISSEKKIKRLAYHDYLTDIPNRFYCQEVLSEFLGRKCPKKALTIALLDFDHFKRINDSLGFEIGDMLIKFTSQRLRELLPKKYFVSRFGGDEFIILLEHPIKNEMEESNNIGKLLQDIFNPPFQVGQHSLTVQSSVGIITAPYHASTLLDCLRVSELALQQAKQNGRNQFVIFDAAQGVVAREKSQTERDLRYALKNNELSASFQPQVNSEGDIKGAEMLCRWNHKQRGMISPSVFIPIAEESGYIHEIDTWMFKSGVKFINKNINSFHAESFRLSINVSPWQLERADFMSMINTTVSLNPHIPEYITLEVTETALLTDINKTKAKLTELRQMGFKVALDDFGTGYSSLAYLKELPLDILKIDKLFVDELTIEKRSPLIDTIMSIATNMNLSVVAEGIENKMQLEALEIAKCEKFQGYYFYKPLPVTEFEALLSK